MGRGLIRETRADRPTQMLWAALMIAVLAPSCAQQVTVTTSQPCGPQISAESGATVSGVPSPTFIAAPAHVPLTELRVEPAFPNLSFDRMVHLTCPDDGTSRLFLVLQPGRIMGFDNHSNVTSTEAFLDIRDRVNDSSEEEGLLGLAFDPQYRSNGHFYVYYSAAHPRRSVISRFSVSGDIPSRADPSSELVILEVPQPFSNHNGGQLLFGPDGYLYIGLGDGGSGGDPRGHGQDRSTLLGSILRIDVSSAAAGAKYRVPPDNPFVARNDGARKEIWAYGLRNPWRFTFDRDTGDLWAGDVGQNTFEEVDLIRRGLNYGWNVMEGLHCFRARQCDSEGLERPVIEYSRSGGCSITGGYVYRGSRLPSLHGAYVYGDFCSGKIWALRYDGTGVTERLQIADTGFNIPAFGEDRSGELYILSFDGRIYRFVPR